jgi:hypothetical protein
MRKTMGRRLIVAAAALILLPLPGAAQKVVITVAGTGIAGYSGDGGPAVYSALNYPRGVTVDSAGNIYVADTSNGRVRKISPDGVVSTAAGGGTSGLGDGGPATSASLNSPAGLALDAAGNLYIADSGSHRIRMVTPLGTISTFAGTGTSGFSGDGASAGNATLNAPKSVAFDGAGNLYIVDSGNNRIRKVDTNGIITTVAGGGSSSPGDGGAATSAQLNSPGGVSVDSAGNIFFAEYYGSRVRKVDGSGTITTVAGMGGGCVTYNGDNKPATSACIYNPQGTALDGAGNLYLSDSGNRRVRKVAPDGIITTVVGNGTAGYSGDGVLGSGTQIRTPAGLFVDSDGNLYIADLDDQRVRRIQASSSNNPVPTVSVLLPPQGEVGGPALSLIVRGANFVPDAVVRWNGADRATNFVSSTQLTAGIPASDLATAGTAQVTVFNPMAGGGGGSSNSVDFPVSVTPVPAVPLVITVAGTGLGGYSGDGGPAVYTTLSQPMGMALDSTGNLFIADQGNNRIRRVGTDGIIGTVAGGGTTGLGDGGAATSAQLSSPSSVALDNAGNLYIADTAQHRVRKVAPDGIITTVAGGGTAGYSGDGGPAVTAKLNSPAGVAVDASGNIFIADTSNNRVRKVTTDGTITTVAGNGIGGYFGDGGPAIYSPLKFPRAVALDAAGNLYIADTTNNRIRKVSADGLIHGVAGSASAGYQGDGGGATSASLWGPCGIVLDGAGNLYIADTTNERIRKVTPAGLISTWAGSSVQGFSGDGGPASAAQFYWPKGVAIDAAGNLYIADTWNYRVRRLQAAGSDNPAPNLTSLTPSRTEVGSAAFRLAVYGANFVPGAVVRWNGADRTTTFVTSGHLTASIPDSDVAAAGVAQVIVWNPAPGGGASNSLNFTVSLTPTTPAPVIVGVAGTGITGYSGDGGPGIYAALSQPSGLAVDSAGNLYVADKGNNRVRKITPSGVVSTVAGGGTGALGDGGPATAARLSSPTAVAVDSAGNLYIADQGYHRVRKVTAAGIISTFAGTGTAGFSGDGGQAASAQLNSPSGLAVDPAGNIFIADTFNHRVRMVALNGTITTVAGTGVAGYFGDGGPAANSPLNGPRGLAFDGAGNLYIADCNNDRVRRVDLAGIISTFAGGGSPLGDGGPATSASLDAPSAVAVDPAGNVYIADRDNHRIRKVTPNGIISTVAGTGTLGYSGDGGQGTVAQLGFPEGVAVDSSGNVYLADTAHDRVRRLQPPSWNGPVPSLNELEPSAVQAGAGTFALAVYGANFVPGATVRWNGSDRATRFMSDANLIATIPASDVLSPGTAQITVSNPTAGGGGGLSNGMALPIYSPPTAVAPTINTVAGTGAQGFGGDGGPASAAQFYVLSGLVVDAFGNLYVTDLINRRVRKIGQDGTITTVAGGGTHSPGDGGMATDAVFSGPKGMAFDGAGNLYIADTSHSVRRVTPGGVITAVAGTFGTSGFSGDGGSAASALLSGPEAVAVDAAGNLYIADSGNSRVRKVSPDGAIGTVAGNGVSGYYGDGGPALNSPLGSSLRGLTLDKDGNLYIADSAAGRIRKVTPGGTILGVAGGGSSSNDGQYAPGAALSTPNAIVFDGSGNLFIAENTGHKVRWMTPGGILTTIAGTGTAGFSGDGGLATAARLNYPAALAVDAAGNLYMADAGNYRIRAVTGASAGACHYALSALVGSFAAASNAGTVSVSTTGGCSWAAASNASWIAVTAGAGGTGGGSVSYSLQANSGASRTGTIAIAGWLFRITQGGAGCNYVLGATGASHGSGTEPGSVSVTVEAGCGWSATSDVDWVAVVSNPSASGNGAVSYIAAANTGQATRNGTLRVAGQTFTITQAGAGCIYQLSAGSAQRGPGAETGTVGVTATAGCPWTAASNANWIAITAGATGTGNGTLSYAVIPNASTSARVGTISIAGVTFTVNQAGANLVEAGSVQAMSGATARIPVTLSLMSGVTLNSLSFTLFVSPVGSAPAPAAALGFEAAATPGAPTTLTPIGTSLITVGWQGLTTALSGTVKLGDAVVKVAASAQSGQSYTLAIAAASGSLGATSVTLTPAPDGTLTVTNPYPAPTLSSVAPAGAVAGTGAFTLTVNGANFVQGSVVRWNGSDRLTTYAGAAQLTAAISAADIAAGGTAQVTVFNPPPGGGTSGAVAFAINLSDTPAALAQVSGDAQSGQVRTVLAAPLVVQVNGATGLGIAGVTVAFAITAGSATLSSQTAVTNSSGQAQVGVTLGNAAGMVNIVASAAGVAAQVVFSATATPGSPASLTIVSGNTQTGMAGSALPEPLVVLLADSYGNPVAGATVNFTVASGGGSLSTASAQTGADGRAQAIWTLGSLGANNAVHASSGTLAVATFTATGTAGAPALLVIVSGNNQTGVAGTTLPMALAVKVTDQNGNPVAGAALDFSATAGGGSVSPTSATTGTAGLAEAFLTLGSAPGANTVQASSGALAPVTFSATGAAPETAQGTVSAAAAQGPPGGTARVPLTLTLNAGVAIDSLAVGIRVLPNGSALALTDSLAFAKDAGIRDPTLADPGGGVGVFTVAWLGMPTSWSSVVRLGEVLVPIPSLATDGQTYTVHLTGVSAAIGATNITVSGGADATISVTAKSYMVGDVSPLLTDQNGDNDTDDAGEFGDDNLTVVDLIHALRAVTGVVAPPACSDRFDAMDSYPVDTPSIRGGNRQLTIVDLIITLRRVTGVDSNKPRRFTQGLVCPAGSPAEPAGTRAELLRRDEAVEGAPADGERKPGPAQGYLELGAAQPAADDNLRVAVYLRAARELLLAGFGFALQIEGEGPKPALRFIPGSQPATLADSALPGILALAWLDGLWVKAGERLLLGYVEAPRGGDSGIALEVFGASTYDRQDGSEVRIGVPPRPSERGQSVQ